MNRFVDGDPLTYERYCFSIIEYIKGTVDRLLQLMLPKMHLQHLVIAPAQFHTLEMVVAAREVEY